MIIFINCEIFGKFFTVHNIIEFKIYIYLYKLKQINRKIIKFKLFFFNKIKI